MNRKKQINLYRSYCRHTRMRLGDALLKSYLVLPAALLGICLAVWLMIAAMNMITAGEIREIEHQLANPVIAAQHEEAEEKQRLNHQLMREHSDAEDLTVGLATYPGVGSDLLDEIRAVGGENVKTSVLGYVADTGELRFEAHSREVIDIPDYVKKLQNTGLFYSVDYTGYEYTRDGEYVLHLRCTLEAHSGR